MSQRKAFNFYYSYYDIAKELSEKDRIKFLWAILQKQFENIDPDLEGMAKFAYSSQLHSITSQVDGYIAKCKDLNITPFDTPAGGGQAGGADGATVGGSGQEKEQGKVKEKEDRSAQFDLFWSKYPNKNSKKPAKEKFMKLSDLDIEKILMTVDAFAAYKQFKDYVHPMATTYLNQRRWEDEIPKVLPDQNKPQITRDVWFIARQIPAQKQKICIEYNLTDEQFNNLFK